MWSHSRDCLLRWLLGLADLFYGKQPERGLEISPISAITCLYATWRLAGLECERVSTYLRHGRWKQSLASFERACALVAATDTLVDVVRQQPLNVPLIVVRARLLATIEHWLMEARHELPMAASYLCNKTTGDQELSTRLEKLKLFISQTN
jgi:hypothetical protein